MPSIPLQERVGSVSDALLSPDLKEVWWYSESYVPGLDQIPEYRLFISAAAYRATGEAPVPEVQAIRHSYRDALTAASVIPEVFMDEEGLDRQFGTAGTMSRALAHLAEVAEETESIRVIPRHLPPEKQVMEDGLGCYMISRNGTPPITKLHRDSEGTRVLVPGSPEFEDYTHLHYQLGESALDPAGSAAMIKEYFGKWAARAAIE